MFKIKKGKPLYIQSKIGNQNNFRHVWFYFIKFVLKPNTLYSWKWPLRKSKPCNLQSFSLLTRKKVLYCDCILMKSKHQPYTLNIPVCHSLHMYLFNTEVSWIKSSLQHRNWDRGEVSAGLYSVEPLALNELQILQVTHSYETFDEVKLTMHFCFPFLTAKPMYILIDM